MSLVGGYDSDDSENSKDAKPEKRVLEPDKQVEDTKSHLPTEKEDAHMKKKIKLPSADEILGNKEKTKADTSLHAPTGEHVSQSSLPSDAAGKKEAPPHTIMVPPQIALKRANINIEDTSDLFDASNQPR